jgi:hypothetical protein
MAISCSNIVSIVLFVSRENLIIFPSVGNKTRNVDQTHHAHQAGYCSKCLGYIPCQGQENDGGRNNTYQLDTQFIDSVEDIGVTLAHAQYEDVKSRECRKTKGYGYLGAYPDVIHEA